MRRYGFGQGAGTPPDWPVPRPAPAIPVGDVAIHAAGWSVEHSTAVLREDTMAVMVAAWPDRENQKWWVSFVAWRPPTIEEEEGEGPRHPRYFGTRQALVQVVGALPFTPKSAYRVLRNIVFVDAAYPHVARAMVVALAGHGFSLWYMNYQHDHLEVLLAERRMDIFGPATPLPPTVVERLERKPHALMVQQVKDRVSLPVFRHALAVLGIPPSTRESDLRRLDVNNIAARLVAALDPSARHFESKKDLKRALRKIERRRAKEVEAEKHQREAEMIHLLMEEFKSDPSIVGLVEVETRSEAESAREEEVARIAAPMPEMGPMLAEEQEISHERLVASLPKEEVPELPPEYEHEYVSPEDLPERDVGREGRHQRWSEKLGKYVYVAEVESALTIPQQKRMKRQIAAVRDAANLVYRWQRGDVEVVR